MTGWNIAGRHDQQRLNDERPDCCGENDCCHPHTVPGRGQQPGGRNRAGGHNHQQFDQRESRLIPMCARSGTPHTLMNYRKWVAGASLAGPGRLIGFELAAVSVLTKCGQRRGAQIFIPPKIFCHLFSF